MSSTIFKLLSVSLIQIGKQEQIKVKEKDYRSKKAKAYEDLLLDKSTKIKPLKIANCVIIQKNN